MAFSEKRHFIRHLLDNPLEYQVAESEPFEETKTVNASEGGLMFLSRRDIAPGTMITLQMPLDDDIFKIKARVAQVKRDEASGMYSIGVAFVEYSDSFKASLKLKLVNVLLVMTFFSSIFSSSGANATEELQIPQKVMLTSTFEKEKFTSKYSDRSLEEVASQGCEYISICVAQYQDNHSSTHIKRTYLTPDDDNVIQVIKKAHGLGLKVVLKPHIDLIDNFDDTYGRSDIGFSSEENWTRWFDAYTKFIVRYAKMAEELKVETFCVGTELSFTTERDDKWRDIIAEVKKHYSGKLAYIATRDNFRSIRFWQDLDLAGVAANFPRPHGPIPSVEDLKKTWEKWHYMIDTLQATAKRPIIFTNKLS